MLKISSQFFKVFASTSGPFSGLEDQCCQSERISFEYIPVYSSKFLCESIQCTNLHRTDGEESLSKWRESCAWMQILVTNHIMINMSEICVLHPQNLSKLDLNWLQERPFCIPEPSWGSLAAVSWQSGQTVSAKTTTFAVQTC